MEKFELPKDFFLGAAMSGPQTEGEWRTGGRLESLWDTWSIENLGEFHNHIGSYAGNDFSKRYREDFEILRDLGLTSVRTSVQWTRLLDQDGKVNPEGVAYYRERLSAARDAGLDLMMDLYHFDMPTYLFRRGGWENREVVEAYGHFVEATLEHLGDLASSWFTFNEPIVEPEMRYQEGIWYPHFHDARRARATQYNISLAHCLGVRAFRAAQRKGHVASNVRIGLISCFTPPYTCDNPSSADLDAVRMTDGISNRWWLDLVTKGELPSDVIHTLTERGIELPTRPEDATILADGVVDWLGCNYYHPIRVQAPDRKIDEQGCPVFAAPYEWPEARMNESRGWEIYPKGIYDFGLKLRDEYPGLEFFISENGMGIEGEGSFRDPETGVIQDNYRAEFVADHLAWIVRAIEEGARIRGYHYWAVIDNWSWANAYKNRYGFIEVDLQNDYERRPKKSAEWLRQVACSKTFTSREGR